MYDQIKISERTSDPLSYYVELWSNQRLQSLIHVCGKNPKTNAATIAEAMGYSATIPALMQERQDMISLLKEIESDLQNFSDMSIGKELIPKIQVFVNQMNSLTTVRLEKSVRGYNQLIINNVQNK